MEVQPIPNISPRMQKLIRKLQREAAMKLDLEGKRVCKKCGHVKLHTHMKKDAKRKYGIQAICKDCDNVVWPKHQRRKEALRQKHQAVVPPATPSIDWNNIPEDVRKRGEALKAAVETYVKPLGTPQGLTPHPNAETLLAPPEQSKALPNDYTPTSPPLKLMPYGTEEEQKAWWNRLFTGAVVKPQIITIEALPPGLRPARPDEQLKPSPPDPEIQAAVLNAVPKTQIEWKVANGAVAEEVKFVDSLRNPCKEIRIVPDRDEDFSQVVLRGKMERMGFSKKMIDGVVKMLPKILKELKELDVL